MSSKGLIQTFVAAICMALAMGAAAQTAAPTATPPTAKNAQGKSLAPVKARVVFQVSDGDAAKWNLTLNNAKNVQEELGADKVEIEIVAYGPGIGMLKADAPIGNRVTEASQAGIKMVACENTMRNQKLSKDDMNTSVGYVPAGVVELMKRQQEGWAYIRP